MASRVVIAVATLMPEKFLNALAAEGARIICVRRTGDGRFLITTDAPGAEKAARLAEQCSLEYEIIRVTGLRAFRDYMRSRPTLPAAFCVMALCMGFFLTRIWIIDMTCLGGTIPESAGECIEEAGIFPGVYSGNVDLPLLSLKLSALEGTAYASAAREGVAIRIKIAGEDAPPELYDISLARDLVAMCDGVISSVEVKSGTAMVKPGDTVRRGQILISGEERISAEETRFVGALGRVTARIWSEGEADGSLVRAEKEYTGRTSRSAILKTPWFEVPLAAGDSFAACDAETQTMPVGGLFLPVSIVRTEYAEYAPRTVYAEREDVLNALVPAAIAAAELKMSQKAIENTEIIDKWIDFSMIDTDTLRARAVIEFTADIAVTRQYLEDN